MSESRGKETGLGAGNMNGHHINGVPQPKSPRLESNGYNNPTKPARSPQIISKSVEMTSNMTNGGTLTNTGPPGLLPPQTISTTNKIPEELMEMLRTRIPDDAYVPMTRLVGRAARTCWSQLIATLNELAEIQPDDPRVITKRMRPPDQALVNDDSAENQRKKIRLWNFAEHNKRVLIKLLVILMWSCKSNENRLTIALNYEIHAMRSAFSNANDKLNEWIVYIVSRQDACPDLDTALEVLATGRVAGVPDLGFAEEKPLMERQMFSTVKKLNRTLSARMVQEENLPFHMMDWHIHDGRVTFKVGHEFELDLSVMDEASDALFMLVDVRFDFRPRPLIPDDLHDQLTTITNQGLAQKGLQGAYEFLHHFCLTLKLKELHSQALSLTEGHWAGHLGIELLKRTLIVQYWTRRTSTKSWIEIGINSGRTKQDGIGSQPPTPFIYLRWMKNGKLVSGHDIVVDLVHVSFENILNQVIAQHTNSIFSGIFDKLVVEKLYAEDDLILEQDSSLIDAFDSKLSVGLSRSEHIQLSCDPVAGTIVISPPNIRSNRVQHELIRSKNIVDDFVARLPSLRCWTSQAAVIDTVRCTSLRYLPGRKPSAAELKSRFGSNTLRAAFFSWPGWSNEWSLVATFGRDEDLWWLVHEPLSKPPLFQVHRPSSSPIHLQHALNKEYFETIQATAGAAITIQISRQALAAKNITAQDVSKNGNTILSFSLGDGQNLESIDKQVIAWPASSKRTSSNSAALLVRIRSRASKAVLRKLASAGLDPSINVHPDKQVLLLSLNGRVSENKVDELLNRLHYIDDLISCIRLVDSVKKLRMDSLTMQNIVISYHTDESQNLGLKLFFKTAHSNAKIQLLPNDGNPHSLVAEHIKNTLVETSGPLSDRLRAILCVLTATLPLVKALQYLQGAIDISTKQKMSLVNLDESRKWIKVHIMSRDMIRFGVHFFALTPNFKKDSELEVTSPRLLVRLEIETMTNESGSRQGWIVRPAVEEFRTYSRPSFTSQALAQRLKEQVFSPTGNQSWMGLGSAARCLFSNPFDLLATLHQTILEWLKEAEMKKEEAPVAVPASTGSNRPQAQGAGAVQQNGSAARVQGPGGPVGQKGNLNPNQKVSQGNRPANVQQVPNQNGPTRVMTAQPQQVRPPASQGRGRGQPFQGRGGLAGQQRLGHGGSGTQNDAIQLD